MNTKSENVFSKYSVSFVENIFCLEKSAVAHEKLMMMMQNSTSLVVPRYKEGSVQSSNPTIPVFVDEGQRSSQMMSGVCCRLGPVGVRQCGGGLLGGGGRAGEESRAAVQSGEGAGTNFSWMQWQLGQGCMR